MENNFKILQVILLLLVGNNAMSLDPNSSSKNILMEIEENQMLGMDCSIYSNSIEAFIIEYKQMFDSLNIACQIHLKSAAGKLKSTIDEMLDQKLDEYLINIEGMKSKVIEMKKSREVIYSIQKSNEKCQGDLKLIRTDLSDTVAERNNLNKVIDKCQSDLGSTEANFTQIIHDKNINVIELIQMGETLNRSVIKCQHDVESLKLNLTSIITVSNNILSFVELIRNGDFAFVRDEFLKASLSLRDYLIDSVYNKNISGAESVIEFLNSFTDNETIIQGYRLLFDQMIKNQHVDSTLTTTIAYRVFVDFNKTYRNNENLVHLRSVLPESLKHFLWNQTVLLINVKLNFSIETRDNVAEYNYDNLRNIPHTYGISKTDNDLALNLIPKSNGKYFYIFSKRYHFYLYAETDEYAYDSNRRAVFAWMKKNETKETGRWQLEPIKGSPYFKLKNMYRNEYLSVAEGVPTKANNHLKLCTLRSGNCDDDICKWYFLRHSWNN